MLGIICALLAVRQVLTAYSRKHGSDADLAIWDPDREVTIRQSMIHDAMEYTPYEGKTIKGWPITTLVRGEVVAERASSWAPPARAGF